MGRSAGQHVRGVERWGGGVLGGKWGKKEEMGEWVKKGMRVEVRV